MKKMSADKNLVKMMILSALVLCGSGWLRAEVISEATEPAVESKPAEETAVQAVSEPASWEYPPVIQMAKYGDGIKITVEPNFLMDRDRIAEIQTIKLESDKGKFLGLMAFTPSDTKHRGEFLVNPEDVESDHVKVMVTSAVDPVWSKIAPLEETPVQLTAYTRPEEAGTEETDAEEAKPEEVQEAPAEPAEPAEVTEEKPVKQPEAVKKPQPKKKGILWW